MFSRVKVLSTMGAAIAALAIGGVSAAPASAATTAGDRQGHELTAVKVSPQARGGVAIQAVTCRAGVYLNPWTLYFDCDITTQTNVSARCSDGYTFTPVTVPPGSYRITVGCYPAFFSSLNFT